MKIAYRIIISVILLAIAGVMIFLSWINIADRETEIIDEILEETTITGTVYANIIEVPADGNNALMVDIEIGRVQVLYHEGGLVPLDMVDEQCNQNLLVAQTAQDIQPGDEVEIFGMRRSGNYYIEVCSSPDYSITVIQPASTEANEWQGDIQATRQVTGEVIELISNCAFDGNCAYVVETESGEQVTIIWAEGMSPICQNDPFQGSDSDIVAGDNIDSFGRVIDESTISGCGDTSYYIRKTN